MHFHFLAPAISIVQEVGTSWMFLSWTLGLLVSSTLFSSASRPMKTANTCALSVTRSRLVLPCICSLYAGDLLLIGDQRGFECPYKWSVCKDVMQINKDNVLSLRMSLEGLLEVVECR